MPPKFSVAKELLMFWSPLVPLLSIGILTAGATNLLMFDLGLDSYKVQLPSDTMNEGATLSASYLRFSLGAGSLFQLWHAFGARLFGRFLLLGFTIATMSPWARYFLPVVNVKRLFWHWPRADETDEAMEIQMTNAGYG